VSYYALFQGWLLLSQPPGCLRAPTTFPTEQQVGDLSRRSGLLPSRRRRLAPATSLARHQVVGIRGLVGVGNPHRAPSPSSALPPTLARDGRLYPHTFRGEPAISRFDWNFSALHRSSPGFATPVGSGLDGVSPPLHPAHGGLTWFRVSSQQPPRSCALFRRLAFAAAPWLFPVHGGHLTCADPSLAGGPQAAGMNSPDHSTKGTPSHGGPAGEPAAAPCSDCLRVLGFRVSFIPLAGCFSPFPHGTRALSVARGI
jgi:hypothetical protein